MKALIAVIKKELKTYTNGLMAYILAVVFLAFNSALFFFTGILQQVASLRRMFQLMPWLFLVFISALTIRSWAEERREKTLQVLLSYPVRVWQLVIGKYLATLAFVSAVLLVTLFVPILLSVAGDFDWGIIFAQYLGAFFMAATMIAIGQWASSLTKNQVVSFVISIAILFAFILIGMEFIVLALPFPVNTIAQQLGLLGHFQSMTRGVIDIRDVFYFISTSFVFLLLTYVWLIGTKSLKSSKVYRQLQGATAVIIAIAVVINLFGQSFTIRFDLTEQNLYSLSDATKSVLRNLDDTVRLTLYRSKELPPQVELVSRDLQDILQDYNKLGGRHVDLQVKFPDQDTAIASEAKNKGVQQVRFNTIDETEFSIQDGYLGVAVEFLDGKEAMPFVQTIEDFEYQLTRAIVKLQETDKKRVGFVSDFGGKTMAEWNIFISSLQQDYTVEQVKVTAEASEGDESVVTSVPDIDDSIDVLIVAAPTAEYSEDAISKIRDYVDRGGEVLWVISGVTINQESLSASKNITGLEGVLEENGVVVNNDIIADLSAHQPVSFRTNSVTYTLPYPLWAVPSTTNHQLVGNVGQALLTWGSSVGLDNENASPLLVTTENSFVQTSSYALDPNNFPDPAAFEMKQYVAAAAVENLPNDGRWVVIGNSSFLDDSVVQRSENTNLALALNSIDWLAQNDTLVGIRSKQVDPSLLAWESNRQRSAMQWINIVVIPLLVAVGGGVWLGLRRRKIKKSL